MTNKWIMIKHPWVLIVSGVVASLLALAIFRSILLASYIGTLTVFAAVVILVARKRVPPQEDEDEA